MRRITCAPCFTVLAETAAQRFGLPSLDGLCFQYVDPDNDRINVNSTDELTEAIAVLGTSSGPLRMVLATSRTGPSLQKSVAGSNGDGLGAAPPPTSAAPGEEHLTQLFTAVIEALELDADKTTAWIKGLDPEEVKQALRKSPFTLISTLLACHRDFSRPAGDTFSCAAGGGGAATSASSSFPPSADAAASAAAAFASTAAFAMAAGKDKADLCRAMSQFPKMVHEMREHFTGLHGRCSPRDGKTPAADDSVGESTDTEVEKQNETKVNEQESEEAPELSFDVQEVVITDTDGDLIVFKLSPDGSRVQEFVNGSLEIDDVRDVQIHAEQGIVRDSKGRFSIKHEEREEKIADLVVLLAHVGVSISPYVPRGSQQAVTQVHLDVNLDASPEQQHLEREKNIETVREAAAAMGADPEQALQKLAAVFAGLPISSTDSGQDAAAALSEGLCQAATYDEEELPDDAVPDNLSQANDCEYLPPFRGEPGAEGESSSDSCKDEESAFSADTDQHKSTPAGRWSEQMLQLGDMGLLEGTGYNEWEIVKLLEKHRGSVDRVVDTLLQKKLQQTEGMI